ncbi:MAG: hypothetical protein QOG03_2474 [Actinomycetota bacterium]|jgi:hypothetical protein|nr:hypothetical protein [Actinomycetota bacterium]
MRRLLIGLGLLVAAVGFVAVLSATAKPAYANARDPITVTIDKPGEADEPALIGNNPSSQAQAPLPGDCRGATKTYCDVVPLDIKAPPGVSVFDAWFAYVEVSWDRTQPGGCDDVVVTNACNDVDIYTYDNTQEDPDHKSYTDKGDSASSDMPEASKLFQPALGIYNVVVNNFAGVNKGYHVKAYIRVFKGAKPFELLAPTTTPSGDGAAAPTPSDPGASGVGDFSGGGAPLDFGSQGPLLAPAPIEVDSAFNDFPIPDDQFRSPPKGPALLGNLIRATAKPPSPASGLLIVLTMLLLPLALIGGSLGWAYKRSRAAFNF